MYSTVKHLPSSAQYLYSVDDISGSVNKLYRAKSKKRLYLVTNNCIYSFKPVDIRQLTNKIISAYDQFHKSEVKDQTF